MDDEKPAWGARLEERVDGLLWIVRGIVLAGWGAATALLIRYVTDGR